MRPWFHRLCRSVDRFLSRHNIGEIAIELFCFLATVWFILFLLRLAVTN